MDKIELYRLRATQAQAMGLLEIAAVFSDAAEEVNRLRGLKRNSLGDTLDVVRAG